ncbi:TonB-dependent receptor [Flavobacterium sp. NG2]|uniref:SusC/RagA family TonB-linked outer membrane protein n=1 Tax=Flavobacterium sp. NG2 TaxID=3097547 RepID=UPI002A831F91|nr:TonB-dependent receptor [Flavobacterium sp. NG2]WPR71013.1 TonB-dependent receptor [Flavobacterium sp. NG2]
MKKTILMFLLVFSSIINAQTGQIKISGKVVDNNGLTIPGVTVTTNGRSTVTDLDGKYVIMANDAKSVINFSYLGFATKNITVGKMTTINVTLVEANNQLNEVVVVGYGSMKKENVTGSVATFKTEILNDLPVSRIDQALQGKIAGVQVQNTSTEAGADPTIQIRGIASINANAQPLVVVDGQPIQDGLSSLNMNDVKDVTVLKDAASASIYGSRGANGVILVTTKSGSESKTKFSFTYSSGIKTPYKKWDIMSITDYVHQGVINDQIRRDEGFTALGTTAQASTVRRAAYFIENILGDGPTNYQDEFLRTGDFKNIQLSASGGTKAVKYYVSGGYNGDEGTFIKSSYNKYNFRSKITAELSKKVTLNLNINPSYSKTQKPVADFNNFIRFSSWLPKSLNQRTIDYILANSDRGFFNANELKVGGFAHPQYFRNMKVPAFDYINGSGTSAAVASASAWTTGGSNPLYSVLVSDDDKEDFRIQSSMDLNFKLAKGLVFKTSVAYYSKFVNRLQFLGHRANLYGAATGLNNNSASYTDQKFVDLLNENLLTYKNTFGKVHDLELTGLFSVNKQIIEESKSTGQFFPDDNIRTLNQMLGSTNVTVDGTKNKLGLISYMGRANYSYNSKYNLTASVRTDGSSLFLNDKWGVFPAVSVGWNIAKENFIANNASWLNKFGLRASYGATGNNRIESISTTNLTNSYNPGYSVLTTTSTITGAGSGSVVTAFQVPSVYSNPDLTWETTWQKNFGLDIGLLKNRLNLSFDIYESKTDNLLLLDSNLPSTGSTFSWLNVGSLQNKGLEIELSTTNINTKNFNWSTSANYSTNRNKLLNFGSLNEKISNNTTSTTGTTSSYSDVYQTKVGQPLIQMYGYVTDGVWKSAQEITDSGLTTTITNGIQVGGLKLKDLNKDGKLDASDRTVIGDPYADFTWGFTNNFKIYNVDLGFSFQGVQGVQVFNGESVSQEARRYNKNFTTGQYVSPLNPGTGTPFESQGINWVLTDYSIEDASYFKLNDITLGYTLNKDFVKQLGLSKLRIYYSAQNLYYHFADGYKGINPEARNTKSTDPLTSGGLQYQGYPISMSMLFGFDINF